MAGMTATLSQVIDEIINGLQVEDVSLEFIERAKITDKNGVTHVLVEDDLRNFMANPQSYNCTEARVSFDIPLIRRRFFTQVHDFFLEFSNRVSELGIDAAEPPL